MPFRKQIELNALETVTAGKTAKLKIAPGDRYGAVWLDVGSTAGKNFAEMVTAWRWKMNGKEFRTGSGQDLIDLNALMGAQYAAQDAGSAAHNSAGYRQLVPFWFSEDWRKDLITMDGLSVATGGLSSFTLELDLDDAIVGPDIDAYAEIDTLIVSATGAPVSPGKLVKWEKDFVAVTSAVKEFSDLLLADYIQSLHFFDADIDRVKITINKTEVFNRTKQRNDAALTSRGMVPVADRFDIVFDYKDALDDALDTSGVNELKIRLELADGTPRDIPMIVQRYGAPTLK